MTRLSERPARFRDVIWHHYQACPPQESSSRAVSVVPMPNWGVAEFLCRSGSLLDARSGHADRQPRAGWIPSGRRGDELPGFARPALKPWGRNIELDYGGEGFFPTTTRPVSANVRAMCAFFLLTEGHARNLSEPTGYTAGPACCPVHDKHSPGSIP